MVLPKDSEYLVIGDLHGCVDELKTLLKQQGFSLTKENLLTPPMEKRSIVLLGDFIDKASEEKLTETIEFIHANYNHLNRDGQQFYLVLGNHEEMVYRYITNDPTLTINAKTIKNKEMYYNTVALLEKNHPLKKLFLELYHASHVWLKYDFDATFSVTLTHAPCPKKHLAKSDKVSLKKMTKCVSRSHNPKMPLDELIPYTHQEAEENQHYHIFGHLSQPNIRRYRNRICIDTSAIYGNQLSCAIIKKNRLSFDSVPFEHRQKPSHQNYNTLFDF